MQAIIKDETGETLGTFALDPKNFSTGSKGFYRSFKVEDGKGQKFQSQVQMVLIGSKPKG